MANAIFVSITSLNSCLRRWIAPKKSWDSVLVLFDIKASLYEIFLFVLMRLVSFALFIVLGLLESVFFQLTALETSFGGRLCVCSLVPVYSSPVEWPSIVFDIFSHYFVCVAVETCVFTARVFSFISNPISWWRTAEDRTITTKHSSGPRWAPSAPNHGCSAC